VAGVTSVAPSAGLCQKKTKVERVRLLRKLIITTAVIACLIAVLVGAQFALIEIRHEVVVVHERTPTGAIHRARLWIVDDGGVSLIHPGNANAQWWVQHMDANAIVEVERRGKIGRYRAQADPAADPKVHRLMRQKYGFADRWDRFLTGTDTYPGLLTGKNCTTVPIRLEPIGAAPRGDPCTFLSVPNGRQTGFWEK